MNRQFLDSSEQGRRIPAAWSIIIPFIIVLGVLMLLHVSSKSRNAVSPLEILLGTPQNAAPQVTAISQDGVTVYMPAGATDLAGTLSIAVTQPNVSLLVEDTEWNLLKVVKVEFRRPNGARLPDIAFSAPVDICFDLSGEQWQAFTENPDSYRVQYHAGDADPARWEILPQITYPDKLQLCGQTYRLSVFALAVEVEPVIPVTGLTSGLVPAEDREQASSAFAVAPQGNTEDQAPAVQPTNPPPTSIPATQPPVARPQPTDPPPVEPPAQGPPDEEKDKEEKDKEKDKEDKDNENKGNGNEGNGQDGDKGNGKDKDKGKGNKGKP